MYVEWIIIFYRFRKLHFVMSVGYDTRIFILESVRSIHILYNIFMLASVIITKSPFSLYVILYILYFIHFMSH